MEARERWTRLGNSSNVSVRKWTWCYNQFCFSFHRRWPIRKKSCGCNPNSWKTPLDNVNWPWRNTRKSRTSKHKNDDLTEWLHSCMHYFVRLSELRHQKAKLSRQVRDKEEELEGTLQKMDALRNDLRRTEKLRRDLEAWAEELQADVVREGKNTPDPFTRTWNDCNKKLRLAKRLWIRWNSTRNLLDCDPNGETRNAAQGTGQSVEFTTRGRTERLERATHRSRQYAGHLRDRIGSAQGESGTVETGKRRRERIKVRRAHENNWKQENDGTTAPWRHSAKNIDSEANRFYCNAEVFSIKTNNNFINQYKSLVFLNLNKFSFSKRELWEVKQQREELARELVRKDSQMKEIQQRLESGDGCKYLIPSINVAVVTKRKEKPFT